MSWEALPATTTLPTATSIPADAGPALCAYPEERFAEVKLSSARPDGPGDGELSNPESMHEQVFKQSVKNLLSSSLKDSHNEPQIQGRYASLPQGMAPRTRS